MPVYLSNDANCEHMKLLSSTTSEFERLDGTHSINLVNRSLIQLVN